MDDPKEFVVEFSDINGDIKGKIIVYPDKPMRFKGNVSESVNIFFNHLKSKIDAYVLGIEEDTGCKDCPDKTPPML